MRMRIQRARAGVLGAAFLKMLRYAEDQFARLHWPIHAKLALSGLFVGLIAIQFPGVWGNGYVMANRVPSGSDSTATLPSAEE